MLGMQRDPIPEGEGHPALHRLPYESHGPSPVWRDADALRGHGMPAPMTAPFDPAAAGREWLETMQGSGLTFAERHESLTALATRAYAAGVLEAAGSVAELGCVCDADALPEPEHVVSCPASITAHLRSKAFGITYALRAPETP